MVVEGTDENTKGKVEEAYASICVSRAAAGRLDKANMFSKEPRVPLFAVDLCAGSLLQQPELLVPSFFEIVPI